jgi:hypothetical protein
MEAIYVKSIHTKVILFGIIAVLAFACALVLASDDAEGTGGTGVIFPSYVVAGDHYSFTITYTVSEGGWTNEPGGGDPGFRVTIPSVEEYPDWDPAPPWDGTEDPWSTPQTFDTNEFGYCSVEGPHKNDATISITGRTVTLTYSGAGGYPQHHDQLVLRYGNLLYRSRVQLHSELDVVFFTEYDKNGDGVWDEVDDLRYEDVVP